MRLTLLLLFILPLSVSAKNKLTSSYFQRADSLLQTVLTLYKVEKYGLLLESYPPQNDQRVDYLSDNDKQANHQEVSYLWPYSGIVSGCVSLYKTTGQKQYKRLLEKQIFPGLKKYWDARRLPHCYQSYPAKFGQHDRFYDDNDWLALDFCDYYQLTLDSRYLDKAIALHKYIYSGWSDELGGGIFWCEQKKKSKNTCSNAPATVLCMKLYQITRQPEYLKQAKRTYEWTKSNLCDPKDSLYWDNIALDGHISKAKFTYNSGQMIQAGVLLFQATGDSTYLKDAQRTAKSAHHHFRKTKSIEGKERLFYTNSPWFNVILFRGLKALYETDGNPTFVKAMMQDAEYAWQHSRDSQGLLNADWSGITTDKNKWLLNNACMVELYSEIGSLSPKVGNSDNFFNSQTSTTL